MFEFANQSVIVPRCKSSRGEMSPPSRWEWNPTSFTSFRNFSQILRWLCSGGSQVVFTDLSQTHIYHWPWCPFASSTLSCPSLTFCSNYQSVTPASDWLDLWKTSMLDSRAVPQLIGQFNISIQWFVWCKEVNKTFCGWGFSLSNWCGRVGSHWFLALTDTMRNPLAVARCVWIGLVEKGLGAKLANNSG